MNQTCSLTARHLGSWSCTLGSSAGFASSIFWFLVLVPQIYHNYKRRSTAGLSLWWAVANFTASLVNVFFVFRLDLPIYTKLMAVYMPTLEFIIIAQFWWFSSKRPLIIVGAALLVWGSIIFIQLVYLDLSPNMEWIATVLWCVETFPQLWLNARLGQATGQSLLTVAITVGGKTTDTLSAFLIKMPLQTRVLCFFSTATAYIDALQVIFYLMRTAATPSDIVPRSATMIQGGDETVPLTSPRLPPSAYLLNESNRNLENNNPSAAIGVLGTLIVICLLLVLLLFTVFEIDFPVSMVLLLSETILAVLCIAIPRTHFRAEREVTAFAKAELAQILPDGFSGTFFLAGGCFKSLQHRRKPSDLDLWPASGEDRALLLRSLQDQGCEFLSDGPFNAKLLHRNSGMHVEVTTKCPHSLLACVSEFDLDLSCIGVKYSRGKIVATYISGRAKKGIKQRKVTVVPKILRHPWNLNSLERMDRYAKELDFTVPESERRNIWKLYKEASTEERITLLENAKLHSMDVPASVDVERFV